MPSPDVTPYVNLTLFDESSQSIYLRALDYALAAFPEFQPREGSIEVALLQAMALEVQDAIFAINRVPGAVTEVLLKLLDIERQAGSRASAIMKFEGDSTTSFSIPEGTRLFYQESQDTDPIVVFTTETVSGQHSRAISGISRTGSTVTIQTSTYHGLSIGASVTIDGTASFDEGPVVLATVPSLSVFTYTSAVSGSASAGVGGFVLPDNTIPARALVEVQTELVTQQFNGTSTNTIFGLLSILPSVASASLATTLLGGSLPETDSQYFARGIATLNRLSAGLSTASQIENFIADGRFPEVYRVKTVDTSDQTRQSSVAGSALIVVAPIDSDESTLLTGVGDGSITPTNVSYGVLDEIYDAVSERIYASLDIEVSHPCFVVVDSSSQIKSNVLVTAASAETACLNYLNNYMSSNSWPWSQYLRVNEVIAGLRQTVSTVGTATYPAVDYVLSTEFTPKEIWLPAEATAYAFDISSISHAADVVTVTTSSNHGVSIASGETLYLWVEGVTNTAYNTASMVEALTATGSMFSFSKTGSTASSSGGRVVAAVKKLASGDLYFMDPAPLVLGGEHVVTVV